MNLLKDKRWCGILLTFPIFFAFIVLTDITLKLPDRTLCLLINSLQRLAFGCLTMYLIKRIYSRKIKDIFSFKNIRYAFIMSAGFLLYFIYFVVWFGTGIASVQGLTVGFLISEVILQQLATGFFEEIFFRNLICEGYRFTKGGFPIKLIYALISAVLFGTVHVLTGWNTYTFLFTGAFGFAMAVIYLQSGNILLPMIFHSLIDIFSHLAGYIRYNSSPMLSFLNSHSLVMVAVMFAVSFILLISKGRFGPCSSSREHSKPVRLLTEKAK